MSITVTDRASNFASVDVSVVRDSVPPSLTVTAQAKGLFIDVSWTATDEFSGLDACTLTAEPSGTTTELSTECSGSMSYPGVQDVVYTFTLNAADMVSNRTDASASATPSGVTKYYYLGAERVAMRAGDEVFYLHGDHLGSTNLTTDEDGEIVSESRYYPFGEERFVDGSASTDFGFTGQRNEAGFGLSDYHARFYSPRLGRFISSDMVIPNPGNSQDWNRYAYVRNSPLIYSDPTGNDPWWVQDRENSYVRTPDNRNLMAAYYDSTLSNAILPPSIQIAQGTPPPQDPTLYDIATETSSKIAERVKDMTLTYNSDGTVDWNATLGNTIGNELADCAARANGTCGISFGGSSSFVVGVRGSADLFVDQNGHFDVLITGGFGANVPVDALVTLNPLLIPQQSLKDFSLIAIRNGNINDMQGVTGQIGGEIILGHGATVEIIVGLNSKGQPMRGVAVGYGQGKSVKAHISITYSISGVNLVEQGAERFFSK